MEAAMLAARYLSENESPQNIETQGYQRCKATTV
jgi:hypothetical protein